MTDVLAGAAKSASYNVVLQLSMRILTFILNGFILRYISRDMLGVVNVRLLLLYTTTQFISREGFRRACLSQTDKSCWSQVISLMAYAVPVTVVIAVIFSSIWTFLLDHPHSIPHYSLAVAVYGGSAVIESLAEPLWLTGQAFLFVKLRVVVDGVSNLVKCVITVALVLCCPHYGLYIFSIAQLSASIVYPVAYYSYFCYYIKSRHKGDNSLPLQNIRELFPSTTQGKAHIDWSTAVLVWSFFKQSVLKQFLTEGERYVMTFFNVLSFADQGVFDIINNLGSLLARFVFASIEEGGYLFFSQSLKRGLPSHQQPQDAVNLCSDVLRCLIKSSILIGITIMVYGFPYAHVALHIYGGSTLSSGIGPYLLRWYCVYVFIIAINGVTECFVFAAMSQEEVDRYNDKMVLFSVVLLGSSWYLTRTFGVVGLVLANCINMASRICHSVYYIGRFYAHSLTSPLTSLKLSPFVIVSYFTTFFIMCLSQNVFTQTPSFVGYTLHTLVGGVCFLVQASVIYRNENDLVDFVTSQYRLRKQKTS